MPNDDTKHTPTPWELWTSNSYRRIKSKNGPPVLYGTQHKDGTGDLVFANPEDAEFLIRAVNIHDEMLDVLRSVTEALDVKNAVARTAHTEALLWKARFTILRAMTPGEYVDFGKVARELCGMQAQYASRLIDGRLGSPNLGAEIRFRGARGAKLDTANYHDIEIHKDDIERFVMRVLAHKQEHGG